MFNLIKQRRESLGKYFDIRHEFKDIEESCIPSYIHANRFAAYVAWLRLIAAAKLYRRFAPTGAVLDFGSSSGELYHLLNLEEPYHFIETNEALVSALKKWIPSAQRQELSEIENSRYGAIFALDVLEHFDDIQGCLNQLLLGMRQSGVFFVSGPTENFLYHIGRKISGFRGQYHTTNIYHIETLISRKMNLLALKVVPCGIPLFRVSAWEITSKV